MRQYASKLLLNFLVSVLATVISGYIAHHHAPDAARADAPLSVAGAVVNGIGVMFGGAAQGNLAALNVGPPAPYARFRSGPQ